jgi:hypothetical protein
VIQFRDLDALHSAGLAEMRLEEEPIDDHLTPLGPSDRPLSFLNFIGTLCMKQGQALHPSKQTTCKSRNFVCEESCCTIG